MADEFPEHDRLKAVRHESQLLGEFIEWMEMKGMWICRLHEGPGLNRYGEYLPCRKRIEEILADYFDIDLNKIEAEKQAMIEEIRKLNAAA